MFGPVASHVLDDVQTRVLLSIYLLYLLYQSLLYYKSSKTDDTAPPQASAPRLARAAPRGYPPGTYVRTSKASKLLLEATRHVCTRMLTNAGVCSKRLPARYLYVRTSKASKLGCKLSYCVDESAPRLARAALRGHPPRMLTYADECWRMLT
jgi:hypothetical protein